MKRQEQGNCSHCYTPRQENVEKTLRLTKVDNVDLFNRNINLNLALNWIEWFNQGGDNRSFSQSDKSWNNPFFHAPEKVEHNKSFTKFQMNILYLVSLHDRYNELTQKCCRVGQGRWNPIPGLPLQSLLQGE